MNLPDLDFSELAHGVDVLAEVHADPDHRHSVCEAILAAVEDIAGTAADDLRRAVCACMWYGDPVEPVRAALAELAVHSAGAATAQVLERQKRAEAAAHGRRGGRPPSEHDADWLRMFLDLQSRNPAQSKAAICRRIAAVWMDEDGAGRSARSIEAGVARAQERAQKVRKKPPFSR